MSAVEANGEGLPTSAPSVVDLPESKSVQTTPSDAEQDTIVDGVKDEATSGVQDVSNLSNIPTVARDNGGEAVAPLQLAQLEALLFQLQTDHNSLLARFDALQGPPVQRPDPPLPMEASLLEHKPVIQPRINPQFWETYLDQNHEPKNICPIDILVGDPEHSPSGKDSTKRIRPSTVDNLRSSRKHGSADKADEAALREMERIKGKYLPEEVRINVFSLQYLLREIFGDKANIPHEDSKRGIILLRPYKNIFKNQGLLKEKLNAFTKLIEAYEDDEKTEALEQQKQTSVSQIDNEAAKDKAVSSEIKEKKNSVEVPPENPRVDQQEARELSATPHSVGLTVDAIDDMLDKLDIFCCSDCNKLLQEEFKTVKDAKDIIKCLSDLMYDFLIPVHENYRKRTPQQVSFSHLWHIFRPGDDLVTKIDPDVDFNSTNLYASLWRVLRVQGGRRELCRHSPKPIGPPPLHQQARQPPPPPRPVNGVIPFTIDTYLLDHDGFTVVPVRRRFLIMPFAGERKIADLEAFPIEYASNRHATKDTLIERGRKFIEYVASKKTGYHLDCRGANLLNKQERLDEQMIVDMEDYWGDARHQGRPAYSVPEPLDGRETTHFCYAFEPCEPSHLQTPIVVDYYVDQELMDDHTKDRYIFNDYNERRLKGHVEMSDDDYAICTHQLHGWLLRSRKHGTVHIDSVAKVHRPRAGLSFNQLVLPPETKDMIQSQVQEHFRKKRSQIKGDGPGLDLVGGKGLGLTILIHGAPGVGKTATAECVADLVEKPLYPLTCGDLGSRAQDIENNLSYHLYAATRWDCILLLDEADVFMAKRTKEDYARNATVSVFLRMLEYYKGVLILTTNRIGTFDEAFKSRIHLSLFYPNFDEDDTVAVFKVFLQRTKKAYPNFDVDSKAIKAFARKHYNDVSEDARWNGRQIRNAFHTALAMAEYDARTKIAGLDPTDPEAYGKECKITVKLGRDQFEAVAKTVALFDDYLEETMGVTHAQRLENEKVRKKKTHVREKNKGKEDEEKELRRRLEAIKKSKAKDRDDDSDDSDDSEEEKPKSKKKKEKGKASKRRTQAESSSSDSD